MTYGGAFCETRLGLGIGVPQRKIACGLVFRSFPPWWQSHPGSIDCIL